MDLNVREETPGDVFGDKFVDGTDTVTCYENGKVIHCDCNHRIGVEHDVGVVACASCGSLVVDREADERGAPERDSGQTSIGDWT